MPKWYGGSALNPDILIPPENQWALQWARVCRWYERCKKLCNKRVVEALTEEDLDEVIAFFQNCFHLREWVVGSHPEIKKVLQQFSRENFEMGACRDICNGYKHKVIKWPSHDPDFNFYQEYDYGVEESGTGESPIRYNFAFAEGEGIRKFDAFDLVEQCFNLWREILLDQGLLPVQVKPESGNE